MTNTRPRGLVILGSGGFAKEVYYHVRDYINYHNVVYFDIYFVDDKPDNQKVFDYQVISFDEIPKPKIKNGKIEVCQFIVGVLDPAKKKRLVKKARDAGLEPSISLAHPTSVIQRENPLDIGYGGIIGPNVFVSCEATIGNYVVLNANIAVHQNVADYFTLTPRSY